MNYSFLCWQAMVPNFRSNVSKYCLETVFLHDMEAIINESSCHHIGCFCLKYIVKYRQIDY